MLSLWLDNYEVDFGEVSGPGYAATSDMIYVYAQTNISFYMLVGAGSEYMDAIDPANDGVKPSSDLELCMLGDCDGIVLPLSTPHYTFPGPIAPWPGDPLTLLGFRMIVNADDPPDTYTARIEISIVPA